MIQRWLCRPFHTPMRSCSRGSAFASVALAVGLLLVLLVNGTSEAVHRSPVWSGIVSTGFIQADRLQPSNGSVQGDRFRSNLLAQKDPDCVASCGNELSDCQNVCATEQNNCKVECESKCQTTKGEVDVTCLNICYLNCEKDSTCVEGCLQSHQSCVEKCPDQKK